MQTLTKHGCISVLSSRRRTNNAYIWEYRRQHAALNGYASINRFAGLAEIEEASDDGSVETLAGTITTHMANLSAQTAASIDANTTQMNALLQQMATHHAQLQQQQQAMMQQMAMLTMNQ